ncbi:hypothetical protein Tco_0583705 [Tanacetum coccineum]
MRDEVLFFLQTYSPEEMWKFEAYLEIRFDPSGIDLTLPPALEVFSSNTTFPTITGEEKICSWKDVVAISLEKEDEVKCVPYPITIVNAIRITFDNPIDFNDHFSKPKDFQKDLTVLFDSSESSILPHPLLDSDSPFTAELSASVTLNSLENEDKVFKPGILVYHAIHDKNLITLEENLKENISSGTLLVFKAPSSLLPPPEPPDKCLNFELILVMKNVMLNEDFYQSNVEDVNSFTIIIWIFLSLIFITPRNQPLISPFGKWKILFLTPASSRFISQWYGYIKNHKKTVKNGQARTRESEEYKKKPKNQSRSQKSQTRRELEAALLGPLVQLEVE